MVDVNLDWFNWFHFLILEGVLLFILIDCMIFLSPARPWNFLPIECFPLTYDLSGFKSRINGHLLTRFVLNSFAVCFNLFVLLFFVPSCLGMAVSALHGVNFN